MIKSTEDQQNALITFIRVPELGKVKTRLAKEVGDHKALIIYKALLDQTKKVCIQVDASRYLFYSTEVVDDDWDISFFIKKKQKGKDLGQRMAFALHEVLDFHQKVIIIGSDCPKLNSSIIEKAFLELDSHDTVIGPTYDGGYYLLGMKKKNAQLFEDMEWSTENVYKETIGRLESQNKSYHVLPKLSDVDYAEDWEKHGWEL